MKKKVVSVLLTAAMLTGLLAGCGAGGDTQPAADNTADTTQAEAPAQADTAQTDAAADTTQDTAADTTADAGEAVTLKWAIWDKDTTPYWQALKDAYEAANPNVTLEMVDLGSADYMTVLATELSGSGSDFDVVTIKDVPGYATLVSKNTLEPPEF